MDFIIDLPQGVKEKVVLKMTLGWEEHITLKVETDWGQEEE